jgi:hypothetical protein
MRGVNPGVGTDIYKSLHGSQSEKKESNPNMESESFQKSLSGGAADSIKRRTKSVSDFRVNEEELQNKIQSIIGGSDVSNKGDNIKIDLSNNLTYFIENLRISSESNDYTSLFKNLVNIYLLGYLEDVNIEGIDKSKIINLIEDFKSIILKVVD